MTTLTTDRSHFRLSLGGRVLWQPVQIQGAALPISATLGKLLMCLCHQAV